MNFRENQNGLTGSDEPIYNIGVVSRMTGIPVATLRVWERRYQFPSAGRTAGGHRLYSEQELARLRWVKSTIDEGMQTSQAIRALHSHERQGRIPELGALTAEPTPQPVLEGSSLEVFRRRFTQSPGKQRVGQGRPDPGRDHGHLSAGERDCRGDRPRPG